MTRSRAALPAWIPWIGLLVQASVAHAGPEPSAAQAGTGGAGSADPRDNSAIVMDPATLAFIPRYDVQAQFVGGPTGELRWNASAVDGRSSEHLSFGLAYHGGILTSPFHPDELPGWFPSDEDLVNKRQVHDINLAIAAPFLDRRLSVGLGGTLSIFKGEFVGKGVTGNLDLGFAARPVEFFTVGLVGRDILPIADQATTPATIALGLRGGKDDLAVGMVDVGVRLEDVVGQRFDVAAGFQGTIRKVAHLRAGWDWNGDTDLHRVSWGLGLYTKSGGIDYAMQIPVNLDPWKFSAVTHTVSLTVFTNFGNRQAEEQPVRWPGER